jgi:hypothetical protein
LLYREIIAVCSQILAKTLCAQNVEFLNVRHGDACLKSLAICFMHFVHHLVLRTKHDVSGNGGEAYAEFGAMERPIVNQCAAGNRKWTFEDRKWISGDKTWTSKDKK